MKKLFYLLSVIPGLAFAIPTSPLNGGTGVSNANTNTITLGGPFSVTGTFPLAITLTGNTTLTLPASGTLITDTGSYSNPSWITSLNFNKITGTSSQIPTFNGLSLFGTNSNLGLNNLTTAQFDAQNPNQGSIAFDNDYETIIMFDGQLDQLLATRNYLTANYVSLTGSYANPSWITSLAASKLTGTITPSGAAGGDLTGTYPNPTVANLAITNAKIANSTIDLTSKVIGILPNSNTTATSTNTSSTIVSRDASGNFAAGTITALAESINSAGKITVYTDTGVTQKGYLGAGFSNDMTLASVTSTNWLRLGANNAQIAFWTDGNAAVNTSPTGFLSTAGIFQTNNFNAQSLSVSSPVFTDASKNLTNTGTVPVANGGTGQTTYSNGQLLIGNSTGNTLAKATLTGTTNQINVTNGAGSVALSTPQDIASVSTPTFQGLNLTNLAGAPVANFIGESGAFGALKFNSNLYGLMSDIISQPSGLDPTLALLTFRTKDVTSGINTYLTLNGYTKSIDFTHDINAVRIVSGKWLADPIQAAYIEYDPAQLSDLGSGLTTIQAIDSTASPVFANSLLFTPVNSGLLSTLAYQAYDNLGNQIGYSYISGSIEDNTSTTPKGSLTFQVDDGSLTPSTYLKLDTSVGMVTTPKDIAITAAGKTLQMKTGSNACIGTGATMVAGTVTVNTTCAKTGSSILLTHTAASGTLTTGMPIITISNNTSFTITGNVLDTSTWSWIIIHSN